jgi:hypothetical protein
MRWRESFVALCAIWAVGLGWFLLAVSREQDALFIAWLVFCPTIAFLAGLAAGRMPGLTWLGLASIALAFGAILLNRQVWNWDQCPRGEEGEGCGLEQVVVWLAGLYALGVAAAIGLGAVISNVLQKTQQRQIGRP